MISKGLFKCSIQWTDDSYFSLQILHNKETGSYQSGQILDFNLGTISSILDVGNVTYMCDLHFDVFVDINKHLEDNTGHSKPMILSNNTAATLTYFKVSNEISCYVYITTPSGDVVMRFENGEIREISGYSIRNVSYSMDHVLVTYSSPIRRINFRCECMNKTYNCTSTYLKYLYSFSQNIFILFAILRKSYLSIESHFIGVHGPY